MIGSEGLRLECIRSPPAKTTGRRKELLNSTVLGTSLSRLDIKPTAAKLSGSNFMFDPARPRARTVRVQHAAPAPLEDRRTRHQARPSHPRASAIKLCRENPVPRDCPRPLAVGTLMPGACTPEPPPNPADQPQTRCTASCAKRPGRAEPRRARVRSGDLRVPLMHDPG